LPGGRAPTGPTPRAREWGDGARSRDAETCFEPPPFPTWVGSPRRADLTALLALFAAYLVVVLFCWWLIWALLRRDPRSVQSLIPALAPSRPSCRLRAGLGGRRRHAALRRAAIPADLLFVVAIVGVPGPSSRNVVLVFGMADFPLFARMARGETLRLRGAPFVEAAVATGASHLRILLRHVLPNMAGASWWSRRSRWRP
jgi:hypothetical protein